MRGTGFTAGVACTLLAACDVASAEPPPVILALTSDELAETVSACLGRTTSRFLFPGWTYFSIAPGRVGAPRASGWRAPDGSGITIYPRIGRPTQILVRGTSPLTAAQVAQLKRCADDPY